MPYYAWPAESFGGLDLTVDADELGWQGAVDLLNIHFDREGRVRSRDGYVKFSTVAAASRYNLLAPIIPFGANPPIMLAARTNATDAITAGGAVAASTTAALTHAPAAIGTPGTTATYLPVGNATVQKLVTTTFSSPAGMPQGFCAAVTPADNRLVIANSAVGATGPAGATSSPSHVWFSNAGAPETWGANNFVQLTPGDGESIVGLIVWRELLFAFKRTHFYVFTGTSTDSAGNPIFNYRTVATPESMEASTAIGTGSAVAGPDGVYYSNSHGIWRTTGGPPVLVSAQLNPLFGIGQIPAFYTGPTFTDVPALTIYQNRLYATVGASSFMAVFDFATQNWSVWNAPAVSILGINSMLVNGASISGLFFSYATGTNDLGSFTTATTDAGAAITSRYQSGFNKFSYKSHFRYIGFGEEKTVRQTQLYGQGTPTLTWFRDFQTTAVPGSGNAVTLGTAPATGRGLDRNAARGEALSFKFSATTAWQVDSLEAMIRGERPVGEET